MFTVERDSYSQLRYTGIGAMPMRTVSPKGEMYPLDHFRNVVNVNLIGTFDVVRQVRGGKRDIEGEEME